MARGDAGPTSYWRSGQAPLPGVSLNAGRFNYAVPFGGVRQEGGQRASISLAARRIRSADDDDDFSGDDLCEILECENGTLGECRRGHPVDVAKLKSIPPAQRIWDLAQASADHRCSTMRKNRATAAERDRACRDLQCSAPLASCLGPSKWNPLKKAQQVGVLRATFSNPEHQCSSSRSSSSRSSSSSSSSSRSSRSSATPSATPPVLRGRSGRKVAAATVGAAGLLASALGIAAYHRQGRQPLDPQDEIYRRQEEEVARWKHDTNKLFNLQSERAGMPRWQKERSEKLRDEFMDVGTRVGEELARSSSNSSSSDSSSNSGDSSNSGSTRPATKKTTRRHNGVADGHASSVGDGGRFAHRGGSSWW